MEPQEGKPEVASPLNLNGMIRFFPFRIGVNWYHEVDHKSILNREGGDSKWLDTEAARLKKRWLAITGKVTGSNRPDGEGEFHAVDSSLRPF